MNSFSIEEFLLWFQCLVVANWGQDNAWNSKDLVILKSLKSICLFYFCLHRYNVNMVTIQRFCSFSHFRYHDDLIRNFRKSKKPNDRRKRWASREILFTPLIFIRPVVSELHHSHHKEGTIVLEKKTSLKKEIKVSSFAWWEFFKLPDKALWKEWSALFMNIKNIQTQSQIWTTCENTHLKLLITLKTVKQVRRFLLIKLFQYLVLDSANKFISSDARNFLNSNFCDWSSCTGNSWITGWVK